jgi:hypothetical protein
MLAEVVNNPQSVTLLIIFVDSFRSIICLRIGIKSDDYILRMDYISADRIKLWIKLIIV